LKLSCAYGGWNEAPGRRHRECFASGIAIGLWPVVANRACSRGFVFGEAAVALFLIAVGIFLLSRRYLRGATIFSFAAWLGLGFFASSRAQEPKPKNYFFFPATRKNSPSTTCFLDPIWRLCNPTF
jgi:hypothetical protein